MAMILQDVLQWAAIMVLVFWYAKTSGAVARLDERTRSRGDGES